MTDKERFIAELAKFLVGNDACKSIELQIGTTSAKEWAALRRATPIQGWVPVKEAERILRDWLL